MDVSAVASDYVHLEKRGGRLWACCPFHKEKTASFTINPDLKTYYCFGCHKGGTMINFIMEMDKISFPEAVELLAKKTGVELVYENSGGGNFSAEDEEKKKRKEELFELYRRITGSFHHFLLKNPEARPARQYILSRGINDEMIERFGLGYSPSDRYWLHTFLSEKGYSKEFLASSGLFSSKDARSSVFSGRIMFPIKDQQGRNVAFGGRFLPGQVSEREGWKPPKYINSPEFGIYKKGETLYALDLALPEIRRTKTVYIAEGYLDVIALHQAGITNALAPLGTAFTDEQVKLLRRWVEKVILFFFFFFAGRAAANKGIL
jgi:DNA primase